MWVNLGIIWARKVDSDRSSSITKSTFWLSRRPYMPAMLRATTETSSPVLSSANHAIFSVEVSDAEYATYISEPEDS